MNPVNWAWIKTLKDVICYGCRAESRGMQTRELVNHSVQIPLEWPVITVLDRKLNYRFMAAEALWMLTGDNKVATIAPYCKNIANYSDDGEIFYGAYGPWIKDQWIYCMETLREDLGSRQSVMTIWRQNPPRSKDIPCTISIQFLVRHNKMNVIVNMRSNDVWLGMTYDIFNFCMIGWMMMLWLYRHNIVLEPGMLYLNAGSRHLYMRNWDAAHELMNRGDSLEIGDFKAMSLYDLKSPDVLLNALRRRVECPRDQVITKIP